MSSNKSAWAANIVTVLNGLTPLEKRHSRQAFAGGEYEPDPIHSRFARALLIPLDTCHMTIKLTKVCLYFFQP